VRRRLERLFSLVQGADPDLDDAIHEYRTVVLRAVMPKRHPLSIN
jgi:hypothetical protein